MPKFRVRVHNIKYRNNDSKYVVFEGRLMKFGKRTGWRDTPETATFVGTVMLIIPNDKFDIDATFVEDVRWGEQYKIGSYHRIEPGTEDEIRKFLVGSTQGLGIKRAEQLVAKYGLDTLPEMRKNPQIVTDLKMSAASEKSLREALLISESFEELLLFLQLHGLDHRVALDVYKRYGEDAKAKIHDDPYAVYLDGVISFDVADNIAFHLGLSHDHHSRMAAATLATLRYESESSGNVFVHACELQPKCMDYLNRNRTPYNDFPPPTQEQLDEAVQELCMRRWLGIEGSGVATRVYLSENLTAENDAVEYLYDIQRGLKRTHYSEADILAAIAPPAGITPAPEQIAAIKSALTQPVSILTGGPGTGKTQTVSMIIQTILALTPTANIKLCAPTGKAAARMSDLTGKKASTIHRLLHIGNPMEELGIGELDCDFLIVDEFSMVDIQLFERLLRSVSTAVRIVIIGDDDQLPSVGPGLVLRDLIESGVVPTTKLCRVFRQSGAGSKIVLNAHAIANQKPGQPIVFHVNRRKGGDCYFIDSDSPSEIRRLICKTGTKLHKKLGIPLGQIQVLSPIHGRELGSDRLNNLLQQEFNPLGEVYETAPYCDSNRILRVGDKVIHTENNYDLNVFNGETGVIRQLGYRDDKVVLVEYPDKDVWYSREDALQLELSYCLTVHKAQGSEYKAIIIPTHSIISPYANRNLIYTAITRAKGIVIIIGERNAFGESLRRHEAARASALVEKLKRCGGVSSYVA